MKNVEEVTTNEIMNVLHEQMKFMQNNMATKDDLQKSVEKTDHAFSDLYEFLQENMVMRSEFIGLEGRFDKFENRFDKLEGRFDKLEYRFDRLEQNIQLFRMDITDRMDQRFTEMNINLGGKITRLVDTLKDKRIINQTETHHILATI